MKITKNKFGFFQLNPLPSSTFLNNYYSKKYYQNLTSSTYQNSYSDQELFLNTIEANVTDLIFNKYSNLKTKSLFDLGCGEGYYMCEMKKLNWNVKGLDFSNNGILNHNPKLLDYVVFGDLFENLDNLNEKFSLLNLDNVLEHVLDPEILLKKCKRILNDDGLIRIEVPNDCSDFQSLMREKGMANDEHIVYPDHISYFNFETLANFLKKLKFEIIKIHGDFPIELYQLNKHSNYIINGKNGKEAHNNRVEVMNYIYKGKGVRSTLKFLEGVYEANISRSCVFYIKPI